MEESSVASTGSAPTLPNAERRRRLAKKKVLLGSRGKASSMGLKPLASLDSNTARKFRKPRTISPGPENKKQLDKQKKKSPNKKKAAFDKDKPRLKDRLGTLKHVKKGNRASTPPPPPLAVQTGFTGDDTTKNMDNLKMQKRLGTLKHVKKGKSSISQRAPTPPPPPPPPPPGARPQPLSIQREEHRHVDQTGLEEQDTRKNLDKRTARLRYGKDFAESIENFHNQHPTTAPTYQGGDIGLLTKRISNNGISVVVRKRPILYYEVDRGEYDVVHPQVGKADHHDKVVVHKCEMGPDMRQQAVKRLSFPVSAAFDQNCTNDAFYDEIAHPLVQLAKQGGLATILMYGQTGSGKTYTMTAIETRAVQDLFQGPSLGNNTRVQIQFVELASVTRDLLSKGEAVRIVEGPDGTVRFLNATNLLVKSPQELLQAIARGKSLRATHATDKNGESSRSHAVCQISLIANQNERHGLLTLIDCAGSERRNDTLYHDKDRQSETQIINSSLFALKECIRGKTSKKSFVNYRGSTLTRVLRESVEIQEARLCLIATVAPNATDTEHTIDTLRVVSSLLEEENSQEDGNKEDDAETQVQQAPAIETPRGSVLAPRQWDNEQLSSWMINKRLVKSPIPDHITGRMAMRMNTIQLRNTFYGVKDDAKASKLFQMLRTESDRVARIQLKERMAARSGSPR